MAFTRAQATLLLTKTEMRLYDDSRANALRGFDRKALDGRIARARAARDRARDLLKRQRGAARARGEGKAAGIAARTARKEALLVEILARFVEARRGAPPARAPAKKTPAKKAAKQAPVKRAATRKAPAKKAAAKAPAKKPAARKATANRVSPGRALENTRRLLQAKHERDRSPQPWQSLDPASDHVPQPGYQSPQAASRAADLHAGESRMASIHGSHSTRDRHNQGKRDHRGDAD